MVVAIFGFARYNKQNNETWGNKHAHKRRISESAFKWSPAAGWRYRFQSAKDGYAQRLLHGRMGAHASRSAGNAPACLCGSWFQYYLCPHLSSPAYCAGTGETGASVRSDQCATGCAVPFCRTRLSDCRRPNHPCHFLRQLG